MRICDTVKFRLKQPYIVCAINLHSTGQGTNIYDIFSPEIFSTGKSLLIVTFLFHSCTNRQSVCVYNISHQSNKNRVVVIALHTHTQSIHNYAVFALPKPNKF